MVDLSSKFHPERHTFVHSKAAFKRHETAESGNIPLFTDTSRLVVILIVTGRDKPRSSFILMAMLTYGEKLAETWLSPPRAPLSIKWLLLVT